MESKNHLTKLTNVEKYELFKEAKTREKLYKLFLGVTLFLIGGMVVIVLIKFWMFLWRVIL